MLFKSIKGMFQIKINYRDAFNLEMFESKYIEECMDKYAYIVGDISSNILRLKGFDVNPNSPAYFKNIQSYLETSCSFGCPHYVLKRVRTQEEYEALERKEANEKAPIEKPLITPIQKENFDKESLVLKTTPKDKPHIVIDINKINAMPKGELASDLVEVMKADKASSTNKNNKNVEPEVKKEETTYVSASPDFDPTKSNSFKFNKNNRNKPNGNSNHKANNNQNNKPVNNNHKANNNKANNNKQMNNNRPNNKPNNNNNKNHGNKKGNNNG